MTQPAAGLAVTSCALIGCGYWGSRLRRYLEEHPAFKLGHVCNSTSDLRAVWNDDATTAVVVATPNHTHYDMVRAALLHGKHVLAEKPLALETAQCRELRDLAAGQGRALLVEYTYTFSQAIDLAQSLVARGHIGRIRGVEAAVRHLGRFKGGSVYWLLGSHMLAVLDMLVPLAELRFRRSDIVTHSGDVETGAILFQNEELSGQIVVSLNCPGKETRIILYGEHGTIVYNPVAQPSLLVETYERLPWTVASELPRRRSEYFIDESHNLRYAIIRFHDAMAGRAEGNVDRAVEITRILEGLHDE